MNKQHLRNFLLMIAVGLTLLTPVQAGMPLWTFTPDPGFPPTVNVSTRGSATILYSVTNQSQKVHTLQMRPIQGISAEGCEAPLAYQQSCDLILTVKGAQLNGDVNSGPILCELGNINQCYQPSQLNSLNIHLIRPSSQQYVVISTAGSNGSINPSGIQTVISGSTLSFNATPNVGYGISRWFLDGTLAQQGGTTYQLTQITANHTVNVTFSTATLTPSVSTLALSINCLPSSGCTTMQNAALTGNPREFTIQNTGSADATNLSLNNSGLPTGTTITTNTCSGTLTAGSSCTVILTPGNIATSDAGSNQCTSGLNPLPGTITITADGGLSTQVAIYVLSYGCIYQGGFIYSVDDTTNNNQPGTCSVTPCVGSIGGKIAATTDTYPGQVNPVRAIPNWGGLGIDVGSSTWDNTVSGGNDGSSNTATIISALGLDCSTDTRVAACLCNTLSVDVSGTSGCTATPCYTGWYLPASCELGIFGNICIAGSTNIQTQLYENISIPSSTLGIVNEGSYWSSTELVPFTKKVAWGQYYSTSLNVPIENGKGVRQGIRCSRALTF